MDGMTRPCAQIALKLGPSHFPVVRSVGWHRIARTAGKLVLK